jgi:hypothetical protein
MEKSIKVKALLTAYKKGYRVDKIGCLSYKGKKPKPYVNDSGYYYFSVRIIIDGKSKSKHVAIHRLQGYQKYGNKIFKKSFRVRHLNGNCKDNSYKNIGIGSQSENMLDISPDKRINRALVASSKKIVFTKEMIILINKDRKNGATYKDLKEKYGYSKGTLSYFFNKAYYNKKRLNKST